VRGIGGKARGGRRTQMWGVQDVRIYMGGGLGDVGPRGLGNAEMIDIASSHVAAVKA
jgi:hypothetical protein